MYSTYSNYSILVCSCTCTLYYPFSDVRNSCIVVIGGQH